MLSRSKSSPAQGKLRIVAIPRSLKLGGWRPLLKRWGELLDQYVDASKQQGEKDCAYWYGERSLTGLLASAAWTLREGWSLEEFAAERGGKKQKVSGRGDLWLHTGTGCYTVEAKLDWPQGDWKKAVTQARLQLRAAQKQLRSLGEEYRYGDPVSLCFIVPYLSTKRASSKSGNIALLFRKIPQAFAQKGALVATYRPPRRIDHGTRTYPGVIVIAEAHKWHG